MSLMRSQIVLSLLLCIPLYVHAADKPVYRCPGKPVLYTDALNTKEAAAKGCTTIEGSPITIISSQRLTAPSGVAGRPAQVSSAGSAPRAGGADSRVDPAEQRTRDSDARRILEAELRKEEEALAQLRKDYNNGEPERRGDEANYQKYIDRVAEMKANLARKEGDVAALRRELSK
jgi:hypothetical protein